jgi:hypothetical protein
MKIGETIRMTGGPFLGMFGTIVGSFGLRVLLSVVFGNREVEIEIERDWTTSATAQPQPISHVLTSKRRQRRAG